MKRALVIVLCISLIYALYKFYQQTNIDPSLKKIINKGAIIIDVRTSKEYSNGHIKESINIPLGEIRERYTELDTSKTYITCCSHGLRSIRVKNLLKERGFQNVYNGGIWKELEKIINETK
ncbi:rhodanese-like domain-containing protein [Aquimarina gracilis]|uniref:Rhodanese-like domain-containing protein n=1 Tax=Aquimarina gracilis TaxID=874422 RepID=A0ABU5ZYV3_9FLAO|nr:rhodanese-like domain-containing protein [Aquimarina gracilis]MEB3347094.1 rhodanese-like domain-containing protein [Aquimarina gracilis]